MNYTYDGTFMGFLSLVYFLFEKKEFKVSIKKNNNYSLFNENYIDTNISNGEKVLDKLTLLLGKTKVNKVFSAFLSEELGVEDILFSYIKKALKLGKKIDTTYIFEVERVERFSSRALHEAHKFKGFVRFRRLKDDTYYAIIDPSHNVLPLLADHFINRFSQEKFVIHDRTRKIALLYDPKIKEKRIVTMKEEIKELVDYKEDSKYLHSEEKFYIDLWRGYFDSVSIESRENPNCQRNFMPKKYWKNLVEVNRVDK